MRKILIILFVAISFTGYAQQLPVKDTGIVYMLKLSESQLLTLNNVLQFSKEQLPTSRARGVDITDANVVIEDTQKLLAALYNEKKKK